MKPEEGYPDSEPFETNVEVEAPKVPEPKEEEKKPEEKKDQGAGPIPSPGPQVEAATKHLQAQIAIKEGGVAVTTLEEQFRFATALFKSGTLPKTFTSPNHVLAGLQLASELGLKPMLALRQMVQINNILSIWGELPLALVRKSGLLESIEEYYIDKDRKRVTFETVGVEIFGAVCVTKRKGSTAPYITWFTKEDVDAAKLMRKDTYAQYFRRMIQMRARSQNFKDNFADVLGGVAIAEYDFHATVTPGGNLVGAVQRDVTSTASDLNKEFGEVVP